MPGRPTGRQLQAFGQAGGGIVRRQIGANQKTADEGIVLECLAWNVHFSATCSLAGENHEGAGERFSQTTSLFSAFVGERKLSQFEVVNNTNLR